MGGGQGAGAGCVGGGGGADPLSVFSGRCLFDQ